MAGQIGGCTAWRLETVSPAEVIARDKPSVVRVQYADERQEVLYQPEVRGSSARWSRSRTCKDRSTTGGS